MYLSDISLSIMPSRSLHVVADGGISFFNGWVIIFHCMCLCIYICICIYICVYNHTFLIHSSVDDHLGCFHMIDMYLSWLLQIMLLWTLGCMYIFGLLFSFSYGIYPAMELPNHMVIFLFLVFWGPIVYFNSFVGF